MTDDDRIREDLTLLADEASTRDIYEDVITSSRRVQSHRTVVRSAVAMTLVFGGAFGAAGFVGSDVVDDFSVDAAAPAEEPKESLDGMFLQTYAWDYAAKIPPDKPDSWNEPFIFTNTDDKTTGLFQETGDLYSTSSVSPDGASVTYLRQYGEVSGEIVIRDIHGGEQIVIGEFNGLQSYALPVWSTDGQRVFLDHGSNAIGMRYGVVDVNTFHETNLVDGGVGLKTASSGDGDIRFWLEHSDFGVEIIRADHNGLRVTPVGDAIRQANLTIGELVAVSPDGEFACLHVGGDLPLAVMDRRGTCTTIINLNTGEFLFDVKDMDDRRGSALTFDLSEGFLLVATDGSIAELVTAEDDIIASVDLPRWETPTLMLRYIPT